MKLKVEYQGDSVAVDGSGSVPGCVLLSYSPARVDALAEPYRIDVEGVSFADVRSLVEAAGDGDDPVINLLVRVEDLWKQWVAK